MSRSKWSLIKQSKSFNVNAYRRALLVLMFSLGLSVCFVILIFYTYLKMPERDYYATSGITPPVKLNALLAPNSAPTALLDPDPPSDVENKAIPQ